MKRMAAAPLKVDVLFDSEQWKDGAAKTVVRRAVTQAAAMLAAPPAELAVLLTDDSKMRALNRRWRGADAPTNVLSFPANGDPRRLSDQPRNALHNHPHNHLGDIVLAYETVQREARQAHRPFAHHLAHLVVHGFLHLLGYDHDDSQDAREMEDAERAILRQLAIPDPYRTSARIRGARPAKQRGRQAAKQAPKQASKKAPSSRARPAQNA